MDIVKEETSARLKKVMEEKRLKQVDIINLCQPYCQKFGVKMQKNDLSQYLSGRSVPTQMKLYILALALGVTEAWLLGYDVPKERDQIKIDVRELTSSELEIVRAARALPDDLLQSLVEYAEYLVAKQAGRQ